MLSNQYLAHYLPQQEKDYQNIYQPASQYLTSPESCPPSTFDSSPSQWNVSPDLSWSEYTSPSFARDCSDNTSSPTYCLPPCAAGPQQPYDCATSYAADPLVAGLYQHAQMNGAMVTSPYHFNPLMYAESDSTCTTATSTPESIPPQQHGFGATIKNDLPGLMDEDEDELVGIGLYEDPETLAREEEACASARFMEPFYPSMHHHHHHPQRKERKMMKLEEEFDPLTAPAQKTRRRSTKSKSQSKLVENKENLPPQPTQASGPQVPASTFYNHYAQQAPSYNMLDSVSGFNGYPSNHDQQQGWSRSSVSSNMMLMMPPPPPPSNEAMPMEGLSFAPVFV